MCSLTSQQHVTLWIIPSPLKCLFSGFCAAACSGFSQSSDHSTFPPSHFQHFSLFHLHPLSSLSTLSPLVSLCLPQYRSLPSEQNLSCTRAGTLSCHCCIPRAWHSAWHPEGTQKITWWGNIPYDSLNMKLKSRQDESMVINVGTLVACGEIVTEKEHKGTRRG